MNFLSVKLVYINAIVLAYRIGKIRPSCLLDSSFEKKKLLKAMVNVDQIVYLILLGSSESWNQKNWRSVYASELAAQIQFHEIKI